MGWRWNLMSPVDGNNTDAVDMQPKDEFHLVQKYFFPTTAHTRQKWKEENLWNFRGQRSAREWEDQWRSKSKKNVDQVGPLIHRYVRSFQSHFALLVQIESLFKVSSRVVYIFLPFSRRSNIDWFSWTSLNSAYSKYRLVGKNNLSRIIFYIVFKFQMTSNTVSCFTRTEQVSTQNAKQQQFSYFFFWKAKPPLTAGNGERGGWDARRRMKRKVCQTRLQHFLSALEVWRKNNVEKRSLRNLTSRFSVVCSRALLRSEFTIHSQRQFVILSNETFPRLCFFISCAVGVYVYLCEMKTVEENTSSLKFRVTEVSAHSSPSHHTDTPNEFSTMLTISRDWTIAD